MDKWLFRKNELSSATLDVDFDADSVPIDPWMRSGLIVGDANTGIHLAADQNERVILIASGSSISVDYVLETGVAESVQLSGRKSVFDGPSDVLYLPFRTRAEIHGDARVIIGQVIARNTKSVQVIRKSDVPILIRGAGRETRQIHNLCMPENVDADRIISVEGIVPAGNWSGVPAHKHDCYQPGKEANLEEIYYFEIMPTKQFGFKTDENAFGYFRGYASDDREFKVDSVIYDQDVVLVPHGYHGPVAAAPGYDLYFFNVMAGNDPDRTWLISDDPNQEWIRGTWEKQQPDSRLPYTAAS